MAPMRHQALHDVNWNDATAMRLLHRFPLRPTEDFGAAHARAKQHALLTDAVETEVIPRLVMRCQSHYPRPVARPAATIPTADQVATLAALAVNGTSPEAHAYVSGVSEAGASNDSLFLDLLSPAARLLGKMWEEDLCDFTDVTIGTLRLANVMRLVAEAFAPTPAPTRVGPRALLVQAPGEQHGFGLTMVEHFFSTSGWNVRVAPMVTRAELTALVRAEWYGLIGISVACSDRMDQLAADIRAVRGASRNPAIGVMVGGPVFVADPPLAQAVGADATAVDGRQAVEQADALLSLLARGR